MERPGSRPPRAVPEVAPCSPSSWAGTPGTARPSPRMAAGSRPVEARRKPPSGDRMPSSSPDPCSSARRKLSDSRAACCVPEGHGRSGTPLGLSSSQLVLR